MKLTVALATVIAALSVHLSSVNQAAPANIEVFFDADAQLVLGEPLIVRLTIRNRATEDVDVNLGWNRKGGVRLRVQRPDGTILHAPALGPSGGISRSPTVRLAAGRNYFQQYVVDEWIPLDQVGTHIVNISLNLLLGASGATVTAPAETSLAVDVKSAEAATLQRQCRMLAIRAVEDADASARIDAAAALSYFRDPSALSCIETVLEKTNTFDSVLSRGLVRMGTESAREVLEKMFRSNDDERYRVANDALTRFRLRER